jgi:hypothetical protein
VGEDDASGVEVPVGEATGRSNQFLVGVGVGVLVTALMNSSDQFTVGVAAGERVVAPVVSPAFEETTVKKTAPKARKQTAQTQINHRM